MSHPNPVKVRSTDFWRYVLIGFFTVAPLWVTWLVFDFILGLLARTGAPLLWTMARAVRPISGWLADWLINPSFQYVLAVLFTIGGLYLIGLLTSFVVGRRLIAWFEALVTRLPLVQTIYKVTKSVLQTLQKPPVRGQRVVLINFPSPQLKTIAFVTRELRDKTSGRALVAVYVPTAPNPTSGYIEILPMDDVVQTDWTVEEAMTCVVTGGTNGPSGVHFTNPVAADQDRSADATSSVGEPLAPASGSGTTAAVVRADSAAPIGDPAAVADRTRRSG
jgi:uncharacterized membrane protein